MDESPLPLNLKVGQASRLPPSAQPTGRLALTRSLGRRDACPTLLAALFGGSKRENGFRRILTPRRRGESWREGTLA
jgi:hypothetical protein